MGPCGSNYPRLRETNEETSNTDRALSFKLVRLSICPFFGDDQTRGAGGSISKIFIGERRTKKTPTRSRSLGLLIVDRVSRKPKKNRAETGRASRLPGHHGPIRGALHSALKLAPMSTPIGIDR